MSIDTEIYQQIEQEIRDICYRLLQAKVIRLMKNRKSLFFSQKYNGKLNHKPNIVNRIE